MGKKQPWNWRVTVLKNTQDELVQTNAWPISRWLSELTALFLHVAPLLFTYKSSCPLVVSGWESAFGQESTPPSGLQASEIKQTFLSTNLASSLASEQRAAGPSLSVTIVLINLWPQGWPFSQDSKHFLKRPGSILGFAGHVISVTIPQLLSS